MKIKVNSQQTKIVSVNTQSNNEVIAVGIQGPAGPAGQVNVERMSDIGDTDITTLINGSILVYNVNTNKWTSTTTLDAQDMEGGEF